MDDSIKNVDYRDLEALRMHAIKSGILQES